MSRLLDNVCSELQRLPGVGRRTAMRLAMHILKMEPEVVDGLAQSIVSFRHDIRYCRSCNNLSDGDLCSICSDTRRDASVVCVVEQVQDLTPTPMTLSSVMFYTGENPYTGEKVYVARSQDDKRRQKSYFFRDGGSHQRPQGRAPQGRGPQSRSAQGRTPYSKSEKYVKPNKNLKR